MLVTLTERTRSLGTSHANYEWHVLVVVAGTAAGQGGTRRSPKEDEIRVWHDEGGSVHQLWWWVLVTLTKRTRSLGISHANYEWHVLVVVAGNAVGQGGTRRSPKEDEIGVWHDEWVAFTSCGDEC